MKVAIFGPGAIGGYLGLCLSSVGVPVRLIGRPTSSGAPEAILSRAVTARGKNVYPSEELRIVRTSDSARDCDVVLVAVKSSDTPKVAEVLRDTLPQGALVVSFQNGLLNPERLARGLGRDVAAGIVAFNVVSDRDQRYQTTRGKLFIEAVEHPRLSELIDAFRRAGQGAEKTSEIHSLMAGKLLVNLHNGISAATGMATWDTLMDPAARRCYLDCFDEGLRVLRTAGLRPRSALPIPLRLTAMGLALPSSIVRPFALLATSRQVPALSSTLVDLRTGRKTEIDELNGAVVRLARAHGTIAPANATVCEIVHGLEGQSTPSFLAASELQTKISAAKLKA